MVNFSILNSKSLTFLTKSDFYTAFEEIVKLLRKLKELKYYNSLKVIENLLEIMIFENMTFGHFIASEKNKDMKRKLLSFCNNQISNLESEIYSSPENEGLFEYKYLNESNIELGYADILNTLLVSFNSRIEWNNHKISAKKFIMDSNGNISEKNVEINNATNTSHIISNIIFFQTIENYKISELVESFPENYSSYFKKIKFSKSLIEQISRSQIDKKLLREAIAILYQIELGKKRLQDFTYSTESETVRNNPKLKDMRKFKIGEDYVYVYDHIKNFSNNCRMYFYKKNENEIWIPYIGPHLKTAEF